MRWMVFLLFLGFNFIGRSQTAPIGNWADYFTYNQGIAVVNSGSKIFWATPHSLAYYDTEDHSIEKFSKVQGLAETRVGHMNFDAASQTVVVGYTNGNLDLVNPLDLSIFNLADIKRSSITGDKRIYHIHCESGLAYVSCGFGIVVLDLFKKEVKDTYIIGPGGSQIKINGVTVSADSIYAATDNGVYKANKNNAFLSLFSSWSKKTDLPAHIANATLKSPYFFGNKLFFILDSPTYGADTCYYHNGTAWVPFMPLAGNDMNSISGAANRILFASTGKAYLTDFNLNFINDVFQYTFGTVDITGAAYVADNSMYISDRVSGLVEAANSWNSTSLKPSGPRTNAVRRIATKDNVTWVAPGNVLGQINQNTFNKDFLSVSESNVWSYINEGNNPLIDPFYSYDVLNVVIDPNDINHVVAGMWSENGLMEIHSKSVTAIYDEQNSILEQYPALPGFCGVAGLAFDDESNLWMSNSYSANPLVVKKSDGTWKKYYCGPQMGNRILGDVKIGDNGYKYICIPTNNPHGTGGLFVYNDAGTIDDDTDDSYRFLNNAEGNGKLPSADVRALAIDLDGEVWVGTGHGPAVIYTPENIFNGGGSFDATQILIEQDGNYQLLLENEIVTDIEVDGANRKWIATETSGAYLISEDGTEQLFHFTAENSPLPSNFINDISINGKSGEVFFASGDGIVSYRGTATESNDNFDNSLVFPNPVRPGYEGMIAINGLSRNSDVKITDLAGNVVFMTKSEGGQAVWDGRTLKGEKAKAGIYLIMCSSENGKERVAGKVVFVN